MSKKNMLCFIVVVLQVFAGVVFAVETHSSIYPLYFDKVASSPDANLAAQEEMWSRLLNFKLFGESHLEFSDRNISVPDEIGWTGTSNGDFVWGSNGGSRVGGPIVVSGDMIFRSGPDSITTGPVVVSGSIRIENVFNFRGKSNFLNVVHCVDGLIDDVYRDFVYDAGIFGLDDCPVSVPAISGDLSIPALYDNDLAWQPAIYVDGAVCMGTLDADGYCIRYIDIPPGNSTYDLYIEALETANRVKIIFRMPENGRLTRVFLKEGFYIASGIKIATMQMSSDAIYSDGAWNGEGVCISNSDYSGNLIFYTNDDIAFPAFTPYDSIQGTFITPGSIFIGSHLTFSGQLIAGNLTIDSDFDGPSFRYVPFDPPFHYVPYDPDFVLNGSDGEKINVTEDLTYTLTKADIPVFDMDGVPWDGDFIVRIISSTHGSLEIDGSAVTLNQDIPLAVLNGTLPYSLTYTPVADAYGDKNDSLEYRLKYGDILSAAYKMYFNVAPVNDAPIIEKASFTIKENSAFGSLDGIATGSVQVDDVDDDSFTYSFYDQFSDTYTAANYDKVTALFAIDAQTGAISVKEGVVLNYESADSVMTVPIIVTDKSASSGIDGDALSTMFNATIRILDVNEPPFILTGQVFTIAEDAVAGTEVLPVDWKVGDSKAVVATDPDISSLSFGTLSYAIKDMDSPFIIDEATGVISLDEKGVLDFETVSSFNLTIVVTDGGGLSDETEINIVVTNINEPPFIVNEIFAFAERSPIGSVVGMIEWGDEDIEESYHENKIEVLDGYEGLFNVDSNGVITTQKNFIYEEDLSTYSLIVKVFDRNNPDLFVVDTISIRLLSVSEPPYFVDVVFSADENPSSGTLVGSLNAGDPDCPDLALCKFTYKLLKTNPYVTVNSYGDILVLTSYGFDYEEVKYTDISVRITDEDGMFSDTTVRIVVNDVNERPVFEDLACFVNENSPVGLTVCELVAHDPDSDSKFNTLEFEQISNNTFFDVLPNGNVELKKSLDYEQETLHVLKVRVNDGEFADTAMVFINVRDILEKSVVQITKVVVEDSTYENPGIIYTSSRLVQYCWREGRVEGDDTVMWKNPSCEEIALTPGRNEITKESFDATANVSGTESVVIFFKNENPTITISTGGKEVPQDSLVYVKNEKTEMSITVEDHDSVFTIDVPVNLKTTYVSSSQYEKIYYTKTGRFTLESLLSTVNPKRVVRDDFFVDVSFGSKINNVFVTIRFTEDENGDFVTRPVMNANGTVNKKEVFEICYTVPDAGNAVVLSYFVDALTGEALFSDYQGNLMTGAAAASMSKSIAGRSTAGLINVTYGNITGDGDSLFVSYTVDDDWKLISDEYDAEGYKVTYAYTDLFGSTFKTHSVFILNTRVPELEIVFPKDGSVFTADSIGIVWTIDGVKQDTLLSEKLNVGMNTITRTYFDQSGEKYSVSISVIRKVENKEKKFSNYLVDRLLKKVKFKITLNGLEVDAVAGSKVEVYDTRGQLVLMQRMSDDVQTFALPKNQNYVVRVGKTSQLVRMR